MLSNENPASAHSLQPATPPRAKKNRMHPTQIVVIGTLLLAVLGLFLPSPEDLFRSIAKERFDMFEPERIDRNDVPFADLSLTFPEETYIRSINILPDSPFAILQTQRMTGNHNPVEGQWLLNLEEETRMLAIEHPVDSNPSHKLDSRGTQVFLNYSFMTNYYMRQYQPCMVANHMCVYRWDWSHGWLPRFISSINRISDYNQLRIPPSGIHEPIQFPDFDQVFWIKHTPVAFAFKEPSIQRFVVDNTSVTETGSWTLNEELDSKQHSWFPFLLPMTSAARQNSRAASRSSRFGSKSSTAAIQTTLSCGKPTFAWWATLNSLAMDTLTTTPKSCFELTHPAAFPLS